MRVPEVADRLREKAAEHSDPELVALADHLRRRRPVRRAKPTSKPMTPDLEAKIVAYAKPNPALTYAAISRVFSVNIGRISEALRGFRH